MISNHKIQMMCLGKLAGFVEATSDDLFHRMLSGLQINLLFENSNVQLVDVIQNFQSDIRGQPEKHR